ncbi:MAG: GTPase ObgE [Anaerolineaceae bacterium]|nr:GTPase ObgE [Anaerolineaceae bacterium]
MFIDEVELYVRSGKGGNGVVHFLKEKYVSRGGPDGGDGGRGGNIVFVATTSLNTLSYFKHQRRFIADDGKRGSKKNQTGRSAEHTIIKVPPGTIIYNADSGELIGDLVEQGEELIVCTGGRGGRGNARFASSTKQVPRVAEKGEPGEERNLKLELKLIADIGLVGVPNAGKSSLLAAVTNAKPKIADYPFTTLHPNLGVADLDENTSIVLADIPGLIEGAHMGVGLGDSFLRHIQRTKVLIHLIDGMAQDPLADFTQINSELALFDERLKDRPQIVVFNKMDLPDVQAKWEDLREKIESHGYEVMNISAVAHINLRPLLWRAYELLQTVPEIMKVEEIPVYKMETDPQDFELEKVEDGWRVNGKAIERAAEMTYWDLPESVRRFQKLLETLGIEEALREAGIEDGDTVYVTEYELDWED